VAAAATRYRVNARAAEGFTDYRRAGIAWPRGAGKYREVLVVDQAADPPGQQLEGELAIGRETFARIKADPHLFCDVLVDGAVAGDDGEKVAMREALEGARLTFDDLRAQLADVEKRLDEAKREQVTLGGENTSLRARVSELEQLLAQATAPPPASTPAPADDGKAKSKGKDAAK
jgi:regulator of replication initiation timing